MQEDAESGSPTEDLELAVDQTRSASNELKHQVRSASAVVTFNG